MRPGARGQRETPFGGTIAHGFLLLSLLSAMTFETLPPLEGSGMGINHGFDKMRFQAPVKIGHAHPRPLLPRRRQCAALRLGADLL